MEIASDTDAFPSAKRRNLCAGISDKGMLELTPFVMLLERYRAGTDAVYGGASLADGPYSRRYKRSSSNR